jgi:hypothetical protein
MYKLNYIINGSVKESFTFPNKQLCNWKKKQLINSHTIGKFTIVKL